MQFLMSIFIVTILLLFIPLSIIGVFKYYRDKKEISKEFFREMASSMISGIVVGLITAIVAFYSTYLLWQIQESIKTQDIKNSEKRHQVFLTSLLTTELQLNYQRIQELDKNVLIEQGFILTSTLKRPTILSFPKPSFEAWNVVRYDNSSYLNNIDPRFQKALVELYFALEEIDRRVQIRKELMLVTDVNKMDLELIHHLGSNIHVAIYSAKHKIFDIAKYLLPNQSIEEGYGKLLWSERIGSSALRNTDDPGQCLMKGIGPRSFFRVTPRHKTLSWLGIHCPVDDDPIMGHTFPILQTVIKKGKTMKRLFLLVLTFVMGLFITSTAHAAPIQWADNGHYYEYINVGSVLFWDDAKAAAEAQGGYLATVTSVEEDDWIWDNIAQGQFLHAWLGGFQPAGSVEPAGGWSWVTGEPWSYTRWFLGNNEPNNFLGNDPNGESVLELGRFKDHPREWNDMDPHTINYTNDFIPGYITEWDSDPSASPVPEPASMLLLGTGFVGIFLKRRLS